MRILLAEDDRHLLTSIARGLREASHEVDGAMTGTAALELALANEYEVIVLDVLLPEQSTFVFAMRLVVSGALGPPMDTFAVAVQL